MIQLIGIDVDGTLVGSSGVVAATVWQAAQRACAAGIHLALCSGRPAFGVALDYARRLDSNGWHVFQNGASVVHLGDGRSRSVSLPSAAVRRLIEHARAKGEALELYSDTAYVAESTSEWVRQHAALLGVHFEAQPFETLPPPIVRAQWLLTPAAAMQAIEDAPPELEVAQSTSPLMPQTRFVGLTQKGITKGSALKIIADEYGIDLRDTMYIGDAQNDLSALHVVGYPVAMANADAEVLKVAKHIVGHVDDGAVAQALEWAMAPSNVWK